jgi:hypothetical protein
VFDHDGDGETVVRVMLHSRMMDFALLEIPVTSLRLGRWPPWSALVTFPRWDVNPFTVVLNVLSVTAAASVVRTWLMFDVALHTCSGVRNVCGLVRRLLTLLPIFCRSGTSLLQAAAKAGSVLPVVDVGAERVATELVTAAEGLELVAGVVAPQAATTISGPRSMTADSVRMAAVCRMPAWINPRLEHPKRIRTLGGHMADTR